ncbi:glycosyltransferase family 2 protein [Chitinasiproducens palmae]|uniref:Glycosyl transferase family 2 n=1 Tax=Chitinasiproducens palmae TaxID=1770053 RepID=A0A1H2PVQ6_9BURK|nr:glycosyltransferase family 2 protein [Chitinasiproducens palmae]SDV50542.1 Glycosyl transferase family 2 [Chitinasiproducens palmae]
MTPQSAPAPKRLVSLCVPTFKRPGKLAEALASCAAQSYRDIEIVIGDDSPDDASEAVVARHIRRHGGVVRYARHRPALGQAGNVNSLFARARGDRLVLLHDDDVLEPHAVETLAACWDATPGLTAAFGKQWLMDELGVVLPAESAALNRRYRRTADRAGLLAEPSVAGVLRMFPNDGFMVDTRTAREVAYRDGAEVGDACDFDFGLRLCLRARAVAYVDQEVARYRLSGDAISRRAVPALHNYELLRDAALPPAATGAREQALIELAPLATSALARSGRVADAWRVLRSRHYGWRRRCSARGAYHLLLMFAAMGGGSTNASSPSGN